MSRIDIKKLCAQYEVKKLGAGDVQNIYEFCKRNTQYYQYCGKELSVELIEQDIEITPPGIPAQQKYYLGFFDDSGMVAVMDLIDGYPDSDCAYIGFFMVAQQLQGRGVGSAIVGQMFDYLHSQDFEKCMLGIDKDNPQSNHFWRKNGFEVVREVEMEEGIILVAERQL